MFQIRPLTNLLVTGGAGFIGSAFIRKLLKNRSFRGRIINLDLLTYAANQDGLREVESNERYEFIQGDICNTALMKQILQEKKIHAIVHFAAESHVDQSIDSPAAFIQTNIFGTYSLLEAVRMFPKVHFHHISTDEVYGSLGMTGAFDETYPYHPNSPYAASKASSDHLVRAFAHTYQFPFTLSHCSNNYGPYQHKEKLIPLMIQKALEGELLPIYGNGKNQRDWLYVDDHVDAIYKILRFGKSGSTYDIGGGAEYSNLEVVQMILKLLAQETGLELESYQKLISFVKDRPGHDFRYAINPAKIKKQLQWSPQISFEEGLLKTIRFFTASHKSCFY
jgi:dTDP-glucose 4,6-dehydratase